MRALCFTLLLVALAACSDPATQLVVVVDTDLSAPDQLRAVRASVKSEAGELISQQVFGLDRARSEEVQVGLPFSFVVVPGGSVGAQVRVELEPLGPDGAAIYTWRALTGFVANKTIRLDAFLAAGCKSRACGAAETCESSGCRSEIFDPLGLPVIEPGAELEGHQRPDAGVGDAGPSDGGRPDSGRDGGPGDGGPPADAGACAPPAQEGASCGGPDMLCCSGACVDTAITASACGPTCVDCSGNAECIAGRCQCTPPFENCDPFPGCEANLDTDPDNCRVCGMMCEVGTPSCIGGECRACVLNEDCADDGLDCTDAPTCEQGSCTYPLLSGSCLIGGACYQGGAINAADACLGCDPMAAPDEWSPRTGMSCSDGLFCTLTDTCDGNGACHGTGTPCNDSLGCTVDSCSETSLCDNAIPLDACVIGGVCRNAGQTIAGNPCLACIPAENQLDWSPNVDAACDDNLYCTRDDACSADGQCRGSGDPCDDGLACTLETCSEGSRTCSVTFVPGTCLIDGNCEAVGNRSPNNECLICDPFLDTRAWSVAPNDSYACGNLGICCNGSCAEPDAGACGTCSMSTCGFASYCACPTGSGFNCFCCPNGLDCF